MFSLSGQMPVTFGAGRVAVIATDIRGRKLQAKQVDAGMQPGATLILPGFLW
jgi:hypothetical protein